MSEFYLFLGLAGVALQLIGYLLLQAGYIKGDGYWFVSMYLFAAIFILLSLLDEPNLPATLEQIIWIVISVGGLVRLYYLSQRIYFSGDEQRLFDLKFPTLQKVEAKKLLNAGQWVNGDEHEILAREGQALGRLIFLLDGHAVVTVADKIVGTCGVGSLIGEVTVLDGAPASASVKLTTPARYFAIDRDALLKLCARSEAIKIALFGSIQKELGDKLRQQNARAVAEAAG